MEWTKDRVGEHWSCGDYRISTFTEYIGGERGVSGYRLYYNREELSNHASLEGAQIAADRRKRSNRCNPEAVEDWR